MEEWMDTPRLWHSRLSSKQTRGLLEHFVAGTPARTAAELVQVNRNTSTYFYHRLRELITARLAQSSPSTDGDIELGIRELYVSIDRLTGRTSTASVLGLLNRGGKIRTTLLPDTQDKALLPILLAEIDPNSLVYTNADQLSNVLDRLGVRLRRVENKDRFKPGPTHMNGMENFWNQTRRHLRKYNGIPAQHLDLYIKECEWRFNYGSPGQLLKTLEQWLARAH
jgi:transposase